MQQSATLIGKKVGEGTASIGRLFLQRREDWSPSRVVLRHKREGTWREYTWAEHCQRVKDFALGLMSLGLERGDKVAVISSVAPDVCWAIHGTWCAGGAVVPVNVVCSPDEVQRMVDFADASFVIAGDHRQVDKLLQIKDDLPKVKRVIWKAPQGAQGYDDQWLSDFQLISEMGKAYGIDHADAFEERIAGSTESDLAGIWYTSGSTGFPKASCRTHYSALKNAEFGQNAVHGALGDDAVVLNAAGSGSECNWGNLALLARGIRLNIPESEQTYQRDLREVGPSYVWMMPMQWESIVSTIQASVDEAHPISKLLYNRFLTVGQKYAACRCQGIRPGLMLRALNSLGEFLVFRPVRDRVGFGRLKIGLTFAYALGEQAFLTLHALGIDVRQFYGGTELGAVASHVDGRIDPGSAGVVTTGCEVTVSPEGELLARSPTLFSHYYKNPEATEKALAGGWFHTGDAGYVDERGNLFVFGRLAEMGELAKGGKYSPMYIEAQLRNSSLIQYAIAFGGRERDYVTAIVTLDPRAVSQWAEKRRLTRTTLLDLSQNNELAGLVLRDIQRVNKALPKESSVKKFVVLHKELDAGEGELTWSRKVKRGAIESRYADLIEAIYSGLTEAMATAPVTYEDGSRGTLTTAVKIRTVPIEG